MKKTIGIIGTLLIVTIMTGCSTFASVPRTAFLHIRGPGNQVNEFAVSLENPANTDMDIHLSDRYALKLDLQWLFYEEEDSAGETGFEYSENVVPPLSPWAIIKYRF
ncbi:MAG: hypothetical protein VR64_08545 [Desulfatitalea sp. BRH_c12]|nr:MAG: hypothetical protein VR64_08545 [Desulfatitalea sp. BRH_c12]